MVQISNEDARIIQALLERGHAFYSEHAVRSKDRDTGRLMAKMAGKIKQFSMARCHRAQNQNNNDNDKETTD